MMKEYKIKYQYATYSGTETIYAEDSEHAIAKMWQKLKEYMTLGMAYKHAEIIEVRDIAPFK
jgi:hypothetical protein